MRPTANQLFISGLKRIKEMHPTYWEQTLKARNDPSGEGSRFYHPQDSDTLSAADWTYYTDPEGLLQIMPGCIGLVAPIPGFVGVEPLSALSPEMYLRLSGVSPEKYAITKELYPVLNGMPKVSAPYTVAILEPAVSGADVLQDPLLSTVVIGRPISPHTMALHEDKERGIFDGAMISVVSLMGRGITHYKVGQFPRRPFVIGDPLKGKVFRGKARAAVRVETEEIYAFASSSDDYCQIIEDYVNRPGTEFRFTEEDGRCPVFTPSSTRLVVYERDVAEVPGAIPGATASLSVTQAQPGAVQRDAGVVSDPDTAR